MAAVLRAGRKKIVSSFVMTPSVHKEFRAKYPQRGDQSYIIEQLVKKLLNGEIFVAPKPVL